MKIAFINPIYGLPIPATMGGAVEELMTILLNEHEKSDSEHKFYFVQPKISKANREFICNKKFSKTELVFVKYNKLVTKFQKLIGKCLKLIKIKKQLPYYFALDYHKKAFKEVVKINPDLIIFENNFDANVKNYIKHFGKEKLYYHVHVQDENKIDVDKYVAGIIGVSDFIKNDYEKYLGKERSTKMNNYVLLNCVNEEKFNKIITQKEKLDLRKKLGFKKDDFVVVYCGRILKKKGVDKLIEAILKTPKNVKLLLIGSYNSIKNEKNEFIDKIEKYVAENPEKIKFTGYIKNQELYRYYGLSDLQVVPSMWEEAAGLVVIEGQLCGLPQIITRSGGMPEYATSETIIIDRNKNLVDDLAKKIISLSTDKEKLLLMKEASLKNAMHYKKEDYYNNFIEIIEDISKKIKK